MTKILNPGPGKISHKIIRNTAFNIIGRFWYIVIGIILTPYIVHRIGPERYGILSLTWVLTGYAGLLDMGIGTSLGRFVALFDSSGEKDKLGAVIGTGLFFYAALSAAVALASVFAIEPLLHILNIPQHIFEEARLAFYIAVICLIINNISGVFASALTGIQRMDVISKGAVGASFITIFGTVWALRYGYGLPGLVAVNTICAMAGCVFYAAVVFLLMPDIMLSRVRITREIFHKLYDFGYKMQVVRIAGIVSTQIDKFLIGALLSIGLVTLYQLGMSVVMSAMSLMALLVSALMPAFVEIDVREGRAALGNAYTKSVRYLAMITIPVFVFMALSADDVMRLWMGYDMRRSALVIQIISMAWMMNVIAQVAANTCMAINKPQLMVRGCSIVLGLNIVLSFLFIKMFGFLGAAWGNAVAITIGVLYYTLELNRALGVKLTNFSVKTLPYLIISLIAGAVSLASNFIINWRALAPDRIGSLISLVVHGFIFSIIYVSASFYFRLIAVSDVSFFRTRLSAVLKLK